MAYNDDIKRIELLLDKYYEANTSVEEEFELKDFFLNNDVPPHLEYDQLQFKFFDQENKLETKVDVANYNFEEKEAPKKRSIIKLLNYAAAASLLVSVGWFSNDRYQQHMQEQAELEIAYQETQKALMILSSNFNVGIEKATTLKEMNKTQTKIINKEY